VVEDILGFSLAKEHSAADWSTRPLPQEWLTYAALDVELLPRVRDEIARILDDAGKTDLAREEFQAQLSLPGSRPRTEPWRRLSGLHQVRGQRALAIARELWLAREELAEETDRAPGRLVPDRSLVAAVLANPQTKSDLAGLKEFHGRASRSELGRWWDAIERGRTTEDLPKLERPLRDHRPRVWPDRNPEAAARMSAAREVLAGIGRDDYPRGKPPYAGLPTSPVLGATRTPPPLNRSPWPCSTREPGRGKSLWWRKP
jgi:ribonuclease D